MTDFDIESFIIKPDELSKPEQILVYSDYGQGKTTFAASAAKFEPTSPVLYLDLEGSTTGVTRDVPPENIDIVRPKNMPIPEGMTKEEGWIHNTDRILVAFLTGEMPREYKTIVIDPLNVYNDWCADHFEAVEMAKQNPNKFAIWTEAAKKTTGSNGIFPLLKDAGVLSILVVHQKTDDNGVADFAWRGSGSRAKVGQTPDVVVHLSLDTDRKTGESHTEAQMFASRTIGAKNRFTLPPFVEDLTIEKLWKLCDNH